MLSHHATLAVRLTRATLTEDPGFAEAADNALVCNIDDLRTTVSPVVGAPEARRFASQWESQTLALFQYAAAIRDDSPDAGRRARRQLRHGTEELTDLVAHLGGGRVDTAELAAALVPPWSQAGPGGPGRDPGPPATTGTTSSCSPSSRPDHARVAWRRRARPNVSRDGVRSDLLGRPQRRSGRHRCVSEVSAPIWVFRL